MVSNSRGFPASRARISASRPTTQISHNKQKTGIIACLRQELLASCSTIPLHTDAHKLTVTNTHEREFLLTTRVKAWPIYVYIIYQRINTRLAALMTRTLHIYGRWKVMEYNGEALDLLHVLSHPLAVLCSGTRAAESRVLQFLVRACTDTSGTKSGLAEK